MKSQYDFLGVVGGRQADPSQRWLLHTAIGFVLGFVLGWLTH